MPIDHLGLVRQRKHEYTAAGYDIIAAEQGRGKNPSRPVVPRAEHAARLKAAEGALHASVREAYAAGHSHQEIAGAARWPIMTVRSVIHKSAFGVEHPVSKAVRLDRALEVVRKPAKVKLAAVKTPLADARFGPVKKGAAAVVDDALVTPARLRVAGPKPQKQAPPAEVKPARSPGQRLNNAIAATGGPSS